MPWRLAERDRSGWRMLGLVIGGILLPAGLAGESSSIRSWSRPRSAEMPAGSRSAWRYLPRPCRPGCGGGSADQLVGAYQPFSLAAGNSLRPHSMREETDLRVLAPLPGRAC